MVVTIFDHGELTFRRTNIGGRLALTRPERECWLAVHESGETCARSAAGLSIRGWAVHEPDWKRELLRTELPAGADEWFDDLPSLTD